jgi:hypothetical protein
VFRAFPRHAALQLFDFLLALLFTVARRKENLAGSVSHFSRSCLILGLLEIHVPLYLLDSVTFPSMRAE